MVTSSCTQGLTNIQSRCTHNHGSSVSQFRPPVGKEVLELPAGLVDDGEVREAPYASCYWCCLPHLRRATLLLVVLTFVPTYETSHACRTRRRRRCGSCGKRRASRAWSRMSARSCTTVGLVFLRDATWCDVIMCQSHAPFDRAHPKPSSPPTRPDPGLTNASMRYVFMKIGESTRAALLGSLAKHTHS